MSRLGLMPFLFTLCHVQFKKSERQRKHKQTDQLVTERGKAQRLNTQEGNRGQVKLLGAITKVGGDKDRKCDAKYEERNLQNKSTNN